MILNVNSSFTYTHTFQEKSNNLQFYFWDIQVFFLMIKLGIYFLVICLTASSVNNKMMASAMGKPIELEFSLYNE